jgi:hypothetical protein
LPFKGRESFFLALEKCIGIWDFWHKFFPIVPSFLGPEPQGKVFKKDGRFYCHLHGPTALALATIGQNGGGQQKKDGKSMKNGTVPNGFNGGDLGRHHYQKRQMTKMENVPAPMAHPKQMMALEKHPPELAKEEEEEEKSQREWWERNADEFNGNKKRSGKFGDEGKSQQPRLRQERL